MTLNGENIRSRAVKWCTIGSGVLAGDYGSGTANNSFVVRDCSLRESSIVDSWLK